MGKARKAEIEYKETNGTFIVPQCTCLKELLTEYVNLYGKDKWALSTYSRNCSLIENYIEPLIGDLKLSDINTRVLEVYYQKLLDTPAVPTQTPRKTENGMVGLSTIRRFVTFTSSCGVASNRRQSGNSLKGIRLSGQPCRSTSRRKERYGLPTY